MLTDSNATVVEAQPLSKPVAASEAQVGVVAIGRNEGERLVRCLVSLAPLGLPVVYVDSASTDGSVAAAEAHGVEVVALDMARPFTAARARVEGFERLIACAPDVDFVQFVDGDCEVEQGWIEAAAEHLATNPNVAVVCGRRRERFPDASRYNAMADVEWNTPVGEATACGGDSMMRCDAYRAVGGFDPAMVAGEEPELCRRLRAQGWRVMRIDQPMTIHDAATFRFGQWWRRAVRSGFGYAQAWVVTRRGTGGALYGREASRAIIWGVGLPAAAVGAALAVHPTALLAWPAALALQIARLTLSLGAERAILLSVGKYAEVLGIATYVRRRLRGGTGATIAYK